MLGVAEEAEAGCEFLLRRKVQGPVLSVVTCQLAPLENKRSSQCSTILPVSSKVTFILWYAESKHVLMGRGYVPLVLDLEDGICVCSWVSVLIPKSCFLIRTVRYVYM